MKLRRLIGVLPSILLCGCVIHSTPTPPAPSPEAAATICHDLYLNEIGRTTPELLSQCVDQLTAGVLTADEYEALVAQGAEAQNFRSLDAHEHGPLHIQGQAFYTEDNRIWTWAGADAYTLAERFCNGEPLAPAIGDPIRAGAKILRVFGMYDGSSYAGGGLGTFRLAEDDPARFDVCVPALIDALAGFHIRVQFLVFADAQHVMPDLAMQRAWVLHVNQLLAGRWNVLMDLGNEWEQNGFAPLAFPRPPPTGLLWSRGSGTGGAPPVEPPWDYLTVHTERGPDWMRRTCRDDQDPYPDKVPCVVDEPMGAAETNSGSRDNDPAHWAQFGLWCRLSNAGCTIHSDAGIFSSAYGPNQLAAAKAFFAGLTFAPPEAQRANYNRGTENPGCSWLGIGPVEHDDGIEFRSYAVVLGNQAWFVQHGTKRAHATACPPWTIVEEPYQGIGRATR